MREAFERVVGRCLEAGLASAEHVAVDGSFIRADANQERSAANAAELPCEDAPRAVRECLADLDGAAPDPEGVVRTPPKAVSLDLSRRRAERQARPVGLRPTRMNAMVDTSSGVILEVQAAPERFADEPIAARRMVERLRDRHGATPGVLTADKAHGAGSPLTWLEDREIEAHVP